MVWKFSQLRSIGESLVSYLSFDLSFLPKFTKSSVHYVGDCMGRAVRCHKEIVTKRLDRRKRRRIDVSKQKVIPKSSKCICSKCTGFRYVQKKRVIEPDFLASLAYSQRLSRNKETTMDAGDSEQVGEITLSADDTWWNNVIKQRNMPPFYRGNLDKPSKSDYSSENSGIRTGTPDIFSDDHDLSRCVTPITVITDDKFFPDDTTYLSQAREGSKSDSKMLTRRDDKASVLRSHAARSASTKTMLLGHSPKEGRTMISIVRRKYAKNRKSSARTASHGSDCLSTCVKCSRILSKAS